MWSLLLYHCRVPSCPSDRRTPYLKDGPHRYPSAAPRFARQKEGLRESKAAGQPETSRLSASQNPLDGRRSNPSFVPVQSGWQTGGSHAFCNYRKFKEPPAGIEPATCFQGTLCGSKWVAVEAPSG